MRRFTNYGRKHLSNSVGSQPDADHFDIVPHVEHKTSGANENERERTRRQYCRCKGIGRTDEKAGKAAQIQFLYLGLVDRDGGEYTRCRRCVLQSQKHFQLNRHSPWRKDSGHLSSLESLAVTLVLAFIEQQSLVILPILPTLAYTRQAFGRAHLFSQSTPLVSPCCYHVRSFLLPTLPPYTRFPE